MLEGLWAKEGWRWEWMLFKQHKSRWLQINLPWYATSSRRGADPRLWVKICRGFCFAVSCISFWIVSQGTTPCYLTSDIGRPAHNGYLILNTAWESTSKIWNRNTNHWAWCFMQSLCSGRTISMHCSLWTLLMGLEHPSDSCKMCRPTSLLCKPPDTIAPTPQSYFTEASATSPNIHQYTYVPVTPFFATGTFRASACKSWTCLAICCVRLLSPLVRDENSFSLEASKPDPCVCALITLDEAFRGHASTIGACCGWQSVLA